MHRASDGDWGGEGGEGRGSFHLKMSPSVEIIQVGLQKANERCYWKEREKQKQNRKPRCCMLLGQMN